MSRRRRRLHVLFAAALLFACGREPEKQRELQPVKVAKSAYLTNAPMIIGDAEGYFAREGIRLQMVDLPNTSVQGLPALGSGEVDVVSAAMSVGFFNAVASGTDLRIVADRGHFEPRHCESFGVVGRRSLFGDRPVRAADLRGRRFALNAVGATGYLAAIYLKQFGMDFSDIEIIRLPATAERQALDDGTIDVVARSDPFFFHLMQGGHRLLAGGNALSPGSHLAVLVFGPSLLRRDRDLGQRFMTAYLRSVRKYNEGATPRNVALVSNGLGLDTADLKRMCWGSTSGDGAVNMKSLIDYQQWAVEIGQSSKILDTTLVTDPEFAARAAQILDAESGRR